MWHVHQALAQSSSLRGKEEKMKALMVFCQLQIAELGGTCAVAAVRIRMGA